MARINWKKSQSSYLKFRKAFSRERRKQGRRRRRCRLAAGGPTKSWRSDVKPAVRRKASSPVRNRVNGIFDVRAFQRREIRRRAGRRAVSWGTNTLLL